YYDQTLFTAWHDTSSPSSVQAGRFDGPNDWAWFGAVPGAISDAAPTGATMANPGHFLLAWKAAGGTSIHCPVFHSLHWAAASVVPDTHTSHSPALARFDNKMHLVWKGPSGDHKVYHATYDGVTWSAVKVISGVATTSQPALATYGGRLVLAFKGKE